MRVFWVRNQMKGRDYWARERLTRYQNQRLHKLREHTYRASAFYQAFHRGLENAPLTSLPVLTKQQLMHNYDNVVTDRQCRLADIYAHMEKSDAGSLFRDKYRVIVTSGSSGSPGIFLFEPWAWAHIIAMEFRILDFVGIKAPLNRRGHSACITSSSPWHQSWQIAHTLRAEPSKNYLYLSAQEPLAEIVDKLNQFQPGSLVSYSNVIYQLALEALEKRLTIAPSEIFCGGEALTAEMRTRIQLAFNQNPYNLYGLTEGGNVAGDCQNRCGMHINEDLVILENVDENYQAVGPDQLGSKVLLTVFFSFTQPIIRYEVSDNLALAREPCSCGRSFRLIATIEGRLEDTLQLVDHNDQTKSLHPNFFHALLDTEPVVAWQLIEDDKGLTMRVVPSLSAPLNAPRLKQKIEQALADENIKPISVAIEQADELVKGKTGKAKLIVAKTAAS